MFKLINAIHYSEHDLNLNHDKILQEVVDSRLKQKIVYIKVDLNKMRLINNILFMKILIYMMKHIKLWMRL